MILRSLFAVAALACATSAAAQSSDPYAVQRIYTHGVPGKLVSNEAARRIMRDYAECNAKYGHDAVRHFLLVAPGTRIPEQEFRKVNDPQCLGLLGGRLRMAELQYRGALAEALIRRDFPGFPVIDGSGIPPLDWSSPRPGPVAVSGRAPMTAAAARLRESRHQGLLADDYIGRVGECTVRSTPTGAIAVLKADRVDTETTALEAISPQVAACVPKGETLTFSRADLRSAIALSYYRLANAAAPVHGATR